MIETSTKDIPMPHCIIEYAKPLESHIESKTILQTVHQTVSQSSLFEPQNVRSRISAYEAFVLGAEQDNFIHITIKILQGRSDEQKAKLTKQVIDAMSTLTLSNVAISCECVDIHNASYQRLSL
ncbi:MAG: 5-carboxymethyl-2-hydroxymuconate Delta-isomerase [Gammaproteobacteria bacterium]|nr:5-carboxymethyl-2-hydroxymuconate Delta-isomerase [Gammaproteobacteria bacterium]